MTSDINGTVVAIQGVSISTTAPTDGQVLVYVNADGKWEPQTIADANVSSSAAIAGSKISPNFGSQSLISGTSTLGTTTSANSITGSLTLTTKTFSTTGTIDTSTNDLMVFADTSSAAFTLTLPTPTNGRVLVIKDKKQSFNSHNLTLARHGSEKIDGTAASLVLSINNQELTITSDGTDWYTTNYSALPTGSASGDLSGTFPSPTVAKLQGTSVSSSAPSDGQVLTYVSGNSDWEPKSLPTAAKCGVYSTSTQTITAGGAASKITNWTVKFDTTSNFSTTNSNFTAPVTGYYHINAQIFLSGTLSAGAGVWLNAYVNGSVTNDKGLSLVGAGSQVQVAYSTIVYATSGQTIDLRCTAGGTNNLTIQNNSDFNYMNINYII